MKTIEKKSWPQEFKDIANDRKHFDVRLADFRIGKGDVLVFKEWNPKTKKYTGKKLRFKVGLIYKIPKDAKRFYSKKDLSKHGLFIIDLKK